MIFCWEIRDVPIITDGKPVDFTVLTQVPNYTAWWKMRKGVNDLAKIVTPRCSTGIQSIGKFDASKA